MWKRIKFRDLHCTKNKISLVNANKPARGLFTFTKVYVPPAISYHLYFLYISKVTSMLHHRSVRRVHSKWCFFIFTYSFLAFHYCFSWKNFCFYHFRFHWSSIGFSQQNISQSETGIGVRNNQWNCMQINP